MLGIQDVGAIRKESAAGVGYSVVELNGIRHILASAVPCKGDTFDAQADDALRALDALIEEEGTRGSIVAQSVFLKDLADLAACRQIMRNFYGREMPATTYVFQPPCEDKLLQVEVFAVGRGRGEVSIGRRDDQMVVAQHDGITWGHVADVRPRTKAAAVYDRSLDAFQQTETALTAGGFRFHQVIRTWLYLGDIVGADGETERYRELNRARTDFYEDVEFGVGRVLPGWQKPVFPASTGIGAGGRDLTLSCLALASNRPDVFIVPLENPQQTSAFDYAHQYGPKSPKFARAMVAAAGSCATTFVSGTASITASETQHVDDVERQTRQTLNNIEALVAEDNFRRHGIAGLGATLDELALARVYVKRREDYAGVRAVCAGRLGKTPVIYTIADVCRPELLVEIEGIAFTARRD